MISLVSANTDEREAVEAVLRYVYDCDILADKDLISEDWPAEIFRQTGNRLFTPKRLNQHQQNPASFDRLLGDFRERIEGVFNEVQNTGRNLERLLRKRVDGGCIRVSAKMASHPPRILSHQRFGVDVPTFSEVASEAI